MLDNLILLISAVSCITSVASLCIAKSTHRMSLFSQKLQNAHALVESFYGSLRGDDVKEFRDIIILRGESAGGDNNGHYIGENGRLCDFSEYFAEGAPDKGALERIVFNLNRVCCFAKVESVDLRFFYSELGHYVRICHEILEAMHNTDYENITRSFKELENDYANLIMRCIGYIEE